MNYWDKRAAEAEIESEGVKITVAEFPGWEFRIGRECPWNQDYYRALTRLAQQPIYAGLIERSSKPGYVAAPGDAELDAALERDAFAEGVLRGWTGVTDRKGKPLPFTPKNARELLAHFAPIFTALRREARNPSRFEAKPENVKAKAIEGN